MYNPPELKLKNNTHVSLSCDKPTYFLWYFITKIGDIFQKTITDYGFDLNCSIDELPDVFSKLTAANKENSFFCFKYNNQTIPYNKQFCGGGGLIFMSNCVQYHAHVSLINECLMPMLVHKTTLNTLLTEYCNDNHRNDNVCNFKILSYNMDNEKERIEFLTKHINCSNNKQQYDKTWVIKEDKDRADGIHFVNNHQLIYKLLSPNKTEQNMYYKNCANINPFKKKKFIRQQGFRGITTENRNGFKMPYKGLLMQEFISNPLLIENRIFHIRSFVLIPSFSKPFIVLHHKQGLLFRNIQEYDNTSLKKSTLASNGHISDGLNDKYKAKNGIFFKQIWGYHRFQTYLNDIYNNSMADYTTNKLQNDIKHIIKHVFNAYEYYNNKKYGRKLDITNKLFNKKGEFIFYIYCLDIVIDDKFQLKLLEINDNCGSYCKGYWAGHDDILDNGGKKWICQEFVKESINILLEMYQKRYNNETIKSIESLDKFEIVFLKH